MAKITTITNPLTGQPAQVDQLDHTAQQIDDAIARALPGGGIDTLLAGKAPAGYGLGTTPKKITDWNAANVCGWYNCDSDASNSPDSNFGWFGLTYTTGNPEIFVQDVFAIANIDKYYHCRRMYYPGTGNGTPWEWVDPLLHEGVEYRTTERFRGSPVYTKTINLSTWPGDGVITSLGSDNVRMFTEAFLTTRMGVVNQGKSSFGLNFEVAPSANYLGGSSSDMTGVVKTYGTDAWGGTKILIVKYIKSA